VLESEGSSSVTFTGGQSIVVPASVEKFMLKPQWDLEFLCASLPVEKVGIPPIFTQTAEEILTGAKRQVL
jgi:hypothetical protein